MLRVVGILLSIVIFISSSVLVRAASPKEGQYFKLLDDGGEHPVCECLITDKLPKKLRKIKELSKQPGYLGSHQTDFAEKNEAAIDSFEHYFSNTHACQSALKKQMAEQGYKDVCESLKSEKH